MSTSQNSWRGILSRDYLNTREKMHARLVVFWPLVWVAVISSPCHLRPTCGQNTTEQPSMYSCVFPDPIVFLSRRAFARENEGLWSKEIQLFSLVCLRTIKSWTGSKNGGSGAMGSAGATRTDSSSWGHLKSRMWCFWAPPYLVLFTTRIWAPEVLECGTPNPMSPEPFFFSCEGPTN